jgi:phage gp36-like protein
MAYLEPAEIKTHLYNGVVDEISRTDNSILQSAIDAAIGEAKGYLSAYDIVSIYTATGAARQPTLLLYTKDIAVWHYIQLANVAVEMELRLKRYEQAVKWLEKVQAGKTNPDLPYPTVAATAEPNNYIKWGSNIKRNNNF